MGWLDIPDELRSRAQWAVAGPDKAPQWLAGDHLRYVSVREPQQWASFDAACQLASARGMKLGYILSADDPFACIDLDVKDASNEPDPAKWTKQEDYDRYRSIVAHMGSYTEVSASGKGLHIWVRGKIGQGVRRDGVEVYSQERFIICTGNRVCGDTIEDRQEMLSAMVSQMRPVRDALSPPLVEIEPLELDIDIINRGFNASNGEKFQALWSGEWKDLGYPSQSEADYALINMLAFYTQSNEQVRRIFRESALGKRKKAQRDDYINRALKTIRRELEASRVIDLAGMQAAMETVTLVGQYRDQHYDYIQLPEQAHAVPPPMLQPPAAQPPDLAQGPDWQGEPKADGKPVVIDPSPEIQWPPGFVGHLAQLIFRMAPRPVKEIAIATAIAHVAGLVGRSWNISDTGLNIYIAIVARSAVGKNIIHSAMNKLSKLCAQKFPMYKNFIDGSNYGSSEGFEKALRQRLCSVHHIKEMGKLLSRMNSGKDQTMANLARSLLDVYDVSGKHDNLGDIVRAKKEDSVAGVMGPVAFSLIGESTPEVFRKATTAEAIEDGLMSRFLTIEYKGDRPERNDNRAEVGDDVVDWLVGIAQYANQLINQNQVIDVQMTPEAKQIADLFDQYCDRRIVGQTLEAKRFVWNRAHLMALKLAAILAVADDYYAPVVTAERMSYAVDLISKSIHNRLPEISDAMAADDNGREYRLKQYLAEYLLRDPPKGEELPHATGCISHRLLRQRTYHFASFRDSHLGSIRALDITISSLIASGTLHQVPHGEVYNLYKKRGKVYRINLSKKELDELLNIEPDAVSQPPPVGLSRAPAGAILASAEGELL